MEVIKTKLRGAVICETKFDSELNQITCVWNGYASPDAVKEWGESYLALMKKHHCPYLLNDDRNSSGPWTKSIEWIENYLVPNLMKEGLQYYAHIVSQNIFASLSANELENKLSDTLTMKTFLTVEKGDEWLSEMRKQTYANNPK